MTEGVYKMQLKFALGTFALLGSLYSVTTLANEIDLNLVCSYSSETSRLTNQIKVLEPKHYTGTMGVRIEREVDIENKVLTKIETQGEERIRFIIWVPFEPDSTPLERSARDWFSFASNFSTVNLLDVSSDFYGNHDTINNQHVKFKIDRDTGIMQGSVENHRKNRSIMTETTKFNGSCQRADPSKRLF